MAEQSTAKRGGGATRKIKWLAVAIVVVAAAYTGLWFFLASRIDEGVARAVAKAETQGGEVVCGDRNVRGYPFRLGLFCSETRLAGPQGSIEAGAFRSAAQVYQPGRVISELEGPMRVEGPGGTIEADWTVARASTRFGTEQLQLGTIDVESPTLEIQAPGAPPLRAMANSLLASVRPNGQGLDAAITLSRFDPEPVDGRDLPPLDLRLDATLTGAAGALAYGGQPIESLRGRTVTLREMRLSLLDGGQVSVVGDVDVDEAGLASGELDVTFSDLAASLTALRTLAPEIEDQIDAVGSMLGQAGGGLLGGLIGGDRTTLQRHRRRQTVGHLFELRIGLTVTIAECRVDREDLAVGDVDDRPSLRDLVALGGDDHVDVGDLAGSCVRQILAGRPHAVAS